MGPWQGLVLNVPAKSAQRVKTTFGIWNQMLPFMLPLEALFMQQLDKFCYTTAVGRSAVNLKLPQPTHYFVSGDKDTKFLKLTHEHFKPETLRKQNKVIQNTEDGSLMTVRVKNMIYGLKHYRRQPNFVKCDMTRGAMIATQLAPPNTARMYPALANYENRLIFSCGGYIRGEYEFVSTVEIYDIAGNEWIPGPELIYKRSHASACALGDQLFVFCGHDGTNNIDRIESLDLSNATSNPWVEVEFDFYFPACRTPLVAPINASQLLIGGGNRSNDYLEDFFTFEKRDGSKKYNIIKVQLRSWRQYLANEKFCAPKNHWVNLSKNQVVFAAQRVGQSLNFEVLRI